MVNDTSFSVVTQFTIVLFKNEKKYFYDVYNRCKYRGGILNVTYAGSWSHTSGLNITLTKSKISRRWNFHKMKLKMSGIVSTLLLLILI